MSTVFSGSHGVKGREAGDARSRGDEGDRFGEVEGAKEICLWILCSLQCW